MGTDRKITYGTLGMRSTFSSKLDLIVIAYKNGDLEKSRKLLYELDCGFDGSIPADFGHTFKLVNWLKNRLYAQGENQGENTSLVNLNEAYFKLLRSQYNWTIKKNINAKSPKSQKISHIKGGRPNILWSDGTKQTIGKQLSFATARKKFASEILKSPVSAVINVVMPTFNSEKFIDSAIMSIISQEGDIEIHCHVQDGGSSDSTLKKLQMWQQLIGRSESPLIHCTRVVFTFISESDDGMYDAINKGFRYLKPEKNQIMCWLNSDDVFAGGAFASAHNIMQNNKDVSWLLNPVSACDKHQKQLSCQAVHYPTDIIAAGLCIHKSWRFIQQEGTFWRAELWGKVSGLSPDLKLAGDWDLWRRFARYSDPVHVEWSLGHFRMHENQLSSNIVDYYAEIDSVVPQKQRQLNASAILKCKFEPIKVIKRPNKKVEALKCCTVQIERKNAFPVDGLDFSFIDGVVRNRQSSDAIKVLTLCTISHGGAGTGSMRRVEALNKIGVENKLITLCNNSKAASVGQIVPALDAFELKNTGDTWSMIHSHNLEKIMRLKGFVGSEYFSTTDSALDFHQLRALFTEFDIIHFHWIVGMLDYPNLHEALKDKPIVWTTADMNAFTGGCHYSEGCVEFTRNCSNCPLISNESTLPNEAWQLKKQAFDKLNIHLVCPSNYIADMAKKSSLMGDKHITVIPNAYPIHKFECVSKESALRRLNIKTDKKLILFGSQDVSNRRKGGDILLEIASLIQNSTEKDNYEIFLFGKGDIALPIKTYRLGEIQEGHLKFVYSACDVFVSLSREDVGPMTVVESLLCGTPVVGFPIGIIPDVIMPNKTGYVAKPFSAEDVFEGIKWATSDRDRAQIISDCVESARIYADPIRAAKSHEALYKSILNRNS